MSVNKKTQKSSKIKKFNFIQYNPHGQSTDALDSSLPTSSQIRSSTPGADISLDSDTWNEATTWIFLQIMLGIHLKLKHANERFKTEVWRHAKILLQEMLLEQKVANDQFIRSLTVDKLQKKWDNLKTQYLDIERKLEADASNNTPEANFIYYEEIQQICKYDAEPMPEIDLERDEKLADIRAEKNKVPRLSSVAINMRILTPSSAYVNSLNQDEKNETNGSTPMSVTSTGPSINKVPQRSNTVAQGPPSVNNKNTHVKSILPNINNSASTRAHSIPQTSKIIHQNYNFITPQGNTPAPQQRSNPVPQVNGNIAPFNIIDHDKYDEETEILAASIRGVFNHAEGLSIQMLKSHREDNKQHLKRIEQMFEEDRRKRKAEMIELLEIFEQRRRIEQEEQFKRIEKMMQQSKSDNLKEQ